jgi:amidophosphoribosyltransferase
VSHRLIEIDPALERELADELHRDRFHDECGVIGVQGHSEAANIAYLGLYALQHRGQESAGIVTTDGGEHRVHRAMGLVADVFNEKTLCKLPGRMAVGHVRYSTAGGSQIRNAQPFCATTDGGPVAIAHNGNLVNAYAIRRELEGRGAIFSTTADSETIVQLLARSRERTQEERLIDALSRVKGAFSLVLMTSDSLIAVRDPYGFRPLCIGRLDRAWVVASETCALDLIGAEYDRDLEPGEVAVIKRGRIRTLRPFKQQAKEHFCIFEHIYFARPDSNFNGHNVYVYRKELGRLLAREHPVNADLIVPVLDSGNTAALGYAEEIGIPYEQAMIRNHYVRRTFIEPAQSIRHFGVKVKHNAVVSVLKGKRVVLVDDSIVRGTTLIKLVTMLRNAGATEVHLRISAPPTVGPCHYGIDTPTRDELIASNHSVDEICGIIGADSLRYLSLEGLRASAEPLKSGFCDACFSNEYPVAVESTDNPPQLSLFRAVEDDGA